MQYSASRTLLQFVSIALFAASVGCTLTDYRLKADREAYRVVSEKGNDPRWTPTNYTIEINPRSRYYDRYDPDRPPMPPDDPAAHQFMHYVDGKRGWKHWDDNGHRLSLENPCWRERLAEYVEITPEGKVRLSIDSALRLTYIHSPDWQSQLETVYLSALDVTTERFRFDTQFFGGNVTTYDHLGRLRDFAPPFRDSNTLRTDSNLLLERRFATAGELAVGVLNSFMWEFSGDDSSSAFSIVNFSFFQPLLRGAGRDRAMEQLTRVERGLLGNLRELERYRQGTYTEVAVGSLGVRDVSRLGGFTGGTGLTGFSGTGIGGLGGVGQATGFGGGFFGFGAAAAGAGGGAGLAGGGAGQVGGFVGLLQSLQEIRNSQYSLDLQERTLKLLEANLESGTIDLTQVDQFRQNIETLRAQLLQARAGLQIGQFNYVRSVIGLPPDFPVELDDDFIDPFQLIDPDITGLQNRITELQDQLGSLAADPAPAALTPALVSGKQLLEDYQLQFAVTKSDLERMEDASQERMRDMTDTQRSTFERDMQQLASDFLIRQQRYAQLDDEIDSIANEASNSAANTTLSGFVGWIRRFSDEVQSLSLIQARSRLESISLESIDLEPEAAIAIARANRLDYMNNRAALVDSWRLIAFNVDQLQSVLNVQLDGDITTKGNNAAEFRAPTGTVRARLEWDAPLTRLLERNNYRQSLIDYHQSRRQLIQFDDRLYQDLMQRLVNMEQLRTNLEIQRRAVIIAIRRVDFTRNELDRPLPPPVPGEPATTFGPTAVQNLLSALSDLSNAQNNFMSVWLNYYSERMQLMRDLGIMQLDEFGRWIDRPFSEVLLDANDACPALPPSIPGEWWNLPDEIRQVYPEEVPPPSEDPVSIERLPAVNEELPASVGQGGLAYPESVAR